MKTPDRGMSPTPESEMARKKIESYGRINEEMEKLRGLLSESRLSPKRQSELADEFQDLAKKIEDARLELLDDPSVRAKYRHTMVGDAEILELRSGGEVSKIDNGSRKLATTVYSLKLHVRSAPEDFEDMVNVYLRFLRDGLQMAQTRLAILRKTGKVGILDAVQSDEKMSEAMERHDKTEELKQSLGIKDDALFRFHIDSDGNVSPSEEPDDTEPESK